MKNIELMRKQLDKQMEDWQKVIPLGRSPAKGWVQAIRKALGMTTKQLAKRAGVHRMRIVQLERAESEDAVTMRSLRSIANHLNCDLVYALVPRVPLQTTIEQQALKIAKQRVQRVSHSMALENQAVKVTEIKEQIADLAKKLLNGTPKNLWDE